MLSVREVQAIERLMQTFDRAHIKDLRVRKLAGPARTRCARRDESRVGD